MTGSEDNSGVLPGGTLVLWCPLLPWGKCQAAWLGTETLVPDELPPWGARAAWRFWGVVRDFPPGGKPSVVSVLSWEPVLPGVLERTQ